MSRKTVADHTLIFTEEMARLDELEANIFARLDQSSFAPYVAALLWLNESPYDTLVEWFGDPHFPAAEFVW